MSDTLSLDGLDLPVERPGSVDELCTLVRRCDADGRAVYPAGGCTMLDVGTPPTRPGIAADTRGLDAIIDYPVRDLTITVQAGVTVARLRDLLAAEGQQLPIDVPDPARATIGGAIAANASGPRRYGRGTFRDYVLGISLVNADGVEVKAGGRVVKNVAGYDLMKLYTGSFGTLGVITQVTLKLRPLPETWALVTAGCTDLAPALDALHASATRPVAIDLTRTANAKRRLGEAPLPPWTLLVAYEDNAAAVAWQTEKVREELAAVGAEPVRVFDGETAPPGLSLTDLPVDPGAAAILQAALRPSAVAGFCAAAATAQPDGWLHAHAGSGIVRLGLPFGVAEPTVRELVAQLGDTAAASSGNLTVRRAPVPWKATLPIWGRPPADIDQQRAVKQALDPANLFNPGRFVVG